MRDNSSSIELPDFHSLTLDQLLKLKSSLQGEKASAHSTRTTRLRSRPLADSNGRHGNSSSTDRVDLAHRVVLSAFQSLDSLKKESEKVSLKSRKYLYEVCGVALSTLYDSKINGDGDDDDSDHEIGKLHLSFILKLLDIGLIDEALSELWTLYRRLPTGQRISSTAQPTYENLLKLRLPKTPQTPLVNVVVTSQILLLKCAQKCAQQQYKPVSNLVIANSLRESNSGPVAWCNALPSKSVCEQKLVLIGKLVLSLSNTASLVTAMHMRVAALRTIPVAEGQYFTMLLNSFEALKRQKSQLEIIKQFGQDIIAISKKHSNSKRSDSFQKILNQCNKVALDTKDPELSDFWNHDPMSEPVQGIEQVIKTFDNFKSDASITILEGIIKALPIRDHCSDPALHRALHGFTERLINDGRTDLVEKILDECYITNLDVIQSSRYPARILELFLTEVKKQQAVPDNSIQLYDKFATIFKYLESWDMIIHISNSLLNSGAKVRQLGGAEEDGNSKSEFLKFWRNSFELELLCVDKVDKSMLMLKAEKLALGLYSRGECKESLEVLIRALQLAFDKYDTGSDSKINDDMQKLITVMSRLYLDFSDLELSLISFNKTTQQILVLETVLATISKSSNPTKLVIADRILDHTWNILDFSMYPLRTLRTSYMYFRVTGKLYAKVLEYWEPILAQISKNELACDVDLESNSSLIKAYTGLTILLTHNYPDKQLFTTLEATVNDLCQALAFSPSDIDMSRVDQFLEFLELQGTHELRIRVLNSVISSRSGSSSSSSSKFKYYYSLARSSLRLGFTGAAHKAIEHCNALQKSVEPIELGLLRALECEYYIDIGNSEESSSILNSLHQFVTSSPSLSPIIINGRAPKETSAHFQQRVILYTMATIAFAKLNALNGGSEVAAVSAQRAVRFLQGFLKRSTSSSSPHNIQSVVSLLVDCMMLTAKMFEKIGVVREAGYYAQEAAKLAESSTCALRLTSILTFEGEMNVRMGKYDSAKELLYRCEELMDGVEVKDLNFLQLVHSLALYLQRQSLFSEENVYYDVSEQAYMELVKRSKGNGALEMDNLVENVSKLKVSNGTKKKAASKTKGQDQRPETVGLDAVHNTILRSRVYSLGLQDAVDGAMEVLDDHYKQDSVKTAGNEREIILFDASKARNYYLMAKKLLELDPVFNVIQDSALSVPSADLSSIKKQERAVASVSATKSKARSPSGTYGDAVHYLVEAEESILKHKEKLLVKCSSIEISEISNLLNNIIIMLNALSKAHDVVSSMVNFKMLEMSKGFSNFKDRHAMTIHKSSTNGYDWPHYAPHSIADFSMDDSSIIDQIPKNWLVVSINISVDSGNLIMSRYVHGEQPFMLSLPLNRHSSRDADEDSFSFEDGLNQLQQIIAASNASAHVSRTSKIKTKQERQEWWEERFGLDKQLQGLLHDVEYCWLGGFRGIFDPHVPNESNASKFRDQFNAILQTHLPSRYKKQPKTKANSKTTVVGLHYKIYELFMGLGNPDELEDPGLLEDLVYFVLDILQFHGEQNAYDELDMDQIVVEMEECIRGFYSRINELPNQKYDHTVLVLDKKCRQFPWESIPLLRRTPVTRVPSLRVLSDALSRQTNAENQMTTVTSDEQQGVYYVLNPGRDLLKTQERFQSVFEGLSNWQGKTAEAPTEEELATNLTSRDVVIYMGHGGGEQYIRSAKIKSLKRCAPTLLLGCSSGALEYGGDYESWGTPLNYMVAGCPMLVANMWDVTDKDTDKFSMKVLERWGVLTNPGDVPVDMASAVMECRDECTLKYLNGSAPVVYGLPLNYR